MGDGWTTFHRLYVIRRFPGVLLLTVLQSSIHLVFFSVFDDGGAGGVGRMVMGVWEEDKDHDRGGDEVFTALGDGRCNGLGWSCESDIVVEGPEPVLAAAVTVATPYVPTSSILFPLISKRHSRQTLDLQKEE
jgi:hypothetical protein